MSAGTEDRVDEGDRVDEEAGQELLVRAEGAVRVVTLHRPAALNAAAVPRKRRRSTVSKPFIGFLPRPQKPAVA